MMKIGLTAADMQRDKSIIALFEYSSLRCLGHIFVSDLNEWCVNFGYKPQRPLPRGWIVIPTNGDTERAAA